MTKNIVGIQYLRGIAAALVVIFHNAEMHGFQFDVGNVGVDIFFVISGFIMWITATGKPSDFLTRRLERIVPIYWLATAATVLVAMAKPTFFPMTSITGIDILRSLLFIPSTANGQLNPVVLQGWTLTYEMMFYVIFTASMFAPSKFRLGLVALLLVAITCASPWLTGFWKAISNPIIIEFLAGMALGSIWRSRLSLPPIAAIMLLLLGLGLVVANHLVTPELPRLFKLGVPATLIVAGTAMWERTRSVPEVGLLKFFGDASYSVYIWHGLAQIIALGILLPLGLSVPLLAAGTLASGFVAGIAAYFAFERPVVSYFQRRRRTRRPESKAALPG